MRYNFVKVSMNSKTGPMPVSGTEKASCPVSCPLKKENGGGCYAGIGPINWVWNKLGKENGLTLKELTHRIKDLVPGKLWRHNQFGDLAISGDRIDTRALTEIVKANKGRKGFTYSHLPPDSYNAGKIKWANQNGFTINLSADSLAEADKFAALGIAPVVTILPENQTENLKTPAGRSVVVCPAYKDKRIQCIDCGLCQNQKRTAIIGFPSHGIGKRKVEAVFNRGGGQ